MTNNQNWPDRVYVGHDRFSEVGLPFDEFARRELYVSIHPECTHESVEYILAEKVREIQLATIRKTLEVLTAAGLREFDIYPESIIEQVKI